MKRGYVVLIIVAAITALLLFLINIKNGRTLESDFIIISHPYERIIPLGDKSNKGFFDPTVEYRDSSLGYLVYSGLEQPSEKLQYPNIEYIHTHLAKSTDSGKTWTFVKRITQSTTGAVESPLFAKIYKLDSNTIEGEWHNEVPTLVYVSDDAGKEWKLYWHKYFSKEMPPGKQRPRILTHSWIMMKEADSPENLESAEEIKLFSTSCSPGARYNFEDYAGKFQTLVTTYSEPGAIYWNGKIYIALSYFSPNNHKLILVSSSDYGKTWDYLGIILDDNDAEAINKDYKSFWGVSLAEEQGRLFLLAPPILKKGSYLGTYVFEFVEIDKAKLKRDSSGKLIPYKYFKRSLPGNINSGEADYHKFNTYGGLIMSQADLTSHPKIAQIWSTKETIITPPPKKSKGASLDEEH